jgi:hypothetical protein
VVFGSAVTGLSAGAGGIFTLFHSSMMLAARAGEPATLHRTTAVAMTAAANPCFIRPPLNFEVTYFIRA